HLFRTNCTYEAVYTTNMQPTPFFHQPLKQERDRGEEKEEGLHQALERPRSPWSTPIRTPLPLDLSHVSIPPFGFHAEAESSGGMYQRSMSMPQTPTTPVTPTSANAQTPRHDVWRSVFNPGSNAANKSLGADLFDKPQPNSPTVYDWYQIVSLYSGETKSTHR
ncbi:hypothetical protein B296_00027965, partial [Ensete ventricosum]